jgi:hypothetical protein
MLGLCMFNPGVFLFINMLTSPSTLQTFDDKGKLIPKPAAA